MKNVPLWRRRRLLLLLQLLLLLLLLVLLLVSTLDSGAVQIAAAMLSGNSLRQTVRTHCASIYEAAKSVAALLRVARVTAGLAVPPDL